MQGSGPAFGQNNRVAQLATPASEGGGFVTLFRSRAVDPPVHACPDLLSHQASIVGYGATPLFDVAGWDGCPSVATAA